MALAATKNIRILDAIFEKSDDLTHSVVFLYTVTASQSTLSLVKYAVQHQRRSKPINIKYHLIRSELQKGDTKLIYIPSE